MRTIVLFLVGALVAGCDPFVVEVNEPAACGVATQQQFTPTPTGWEARVTIDLPVQSAMQSAKNASARATLGSVSLSSTSGKLSTVNGAHVQLADATVSSGSAPTLDGQTLTIGGSDTDVLPQLEQGPAQLVISLDGDSRDGKPLVADVGACAALDLKDAYLK